MSIKQLYICFFFDVIAKSVTFTRDKENVCMDKQRQKIMQAIAKRAHEVTPPGSTILLFGSQARGDARPDSDWDVLVLLDKEKITFRDEDEIAYPIHTLGWDYDEIINPLLFTKKQWKDNRIAVFRHNVLEDAIPL